MVIVFIKLKEFLILCFLYPQHPALPCVTKTLFYGVILLLLPVQQYEHTNVNMVHTYLVHSTCCYKSTRPVRCVEHVEIGCNM
jgi:hypothetical protein